MVVCLVGCESLILIICRSCLGCVFGECSSQFVSCQDGQKGQSGAHPCTQGSQLDDSYDVALRDNV